MEFFFSLYSLIDTLLMPVYRFPDNSLIGYFLGTTLLSFACIVIGEGTMDFAFRFNREMIGKNTGEMNHFQGLSVEALKSGDKTAFRACNGIANEAYGKSFFSQIALSASSLWPVFIALGWMQYRFAAVDISTLLPMPLSGPAIGYFASFMFCYISTRAIMTKIRRVSFHAKNRSSSE